MLLQVNLEQLEASQTLQISWSNTLHIVMHLLSVRSSGKVSSVLARWALCTIPVLCCGPHGRVQHASVHPERVQSDGRQGRFSSVELCCWCVRQQQEGGVNSSRINWPSGILVVFHLHCFHSETEDLDHPLPTWGQSSVIGKTTGQDGDHGDLKYTSQVCSRELLLFSL